MSAIEHGHAWITGKSSIGWGIFLHTIQIRLAELSEMLVLWESGGRRAVDIVAKTGILR